MSAKIIGFPNKADQIWLHLRPHVYEAAFKRSGSKKIADHVTMVMEEKYHECVPEKFSPSEVSSDAAKKEFSNYIHNIVGAFVFQLATVLTDGFILAESLD